MIKKYFFILVVSLLTSSSMAQMNKISAGTRLYLQTLDTSNRQARARSNDGAVKLKEAKLFVSCDSDADTKVIEAKLKKIGVMPQGTVGRYIMVSTPISLVEKMAAIEGVTYVSKGPNINQETLISRSVTGASKVHDGADGLPQAFTGKGVVVGVIDMGFDFAHPAYKDAEGNLRIKAFYAPRLTGDSGAPVVTLDGTTIGGKAFTTPEDILEIESDTKMGSHGSHCAATAAGSSFDWAGGMAPDADIVLCSLVMSEDESGDDDDVRDEMAYSLMQSIMFIRDYAKREGKPCIISMSLNSHDGPHDGTSFTSSMLNQLALENTNMVLAVSNEGNNKCYINHTYAANDTVHTIVVGNMQISAFTRKPSELSVQLGYFDPAVMTEVWRSEPLRSTNGGCSFKFDLNDGDDETTPYEDIRSHMAEFVDSPLNFSLGTLEDGRANLFIDCSGSPTEGYFVMHIASSENSVVDIWGDGNANLFKLSSSNYYTEGVTNVSMGDFCTGGTIITVGSWAAKPSFTNINGETIEGGFFVLGDGVGSYSPFSSYGTDIAGHDHPFVSTPGSMIISAVNHYDPEYDPETNGDVVTKDAEGFTWASMSGTSMATPTAAGIIALWLEAKPDLTYEQIRETIIATSDTDDFTEATPIRFGHGKMNAYKGLLHILGINTAISELSPHQPKGVTFRMTGGSLFIDGAEDGIPIRIYTVGGRLVVSTLLTNGSVNLPVAIPAGVYAVQVGKLGSTLIRK